MINLGCPTFVVRRHELNNFGAVFETKRRGLVGCQGPDRIKGVRTNLTFLGYEVSRGAGSSEVLRSTLTIRELYQ
jgi:hypothetical protein